ncbi:MAG: hypothetical protein ABIP48_17650, partial [Planctomycetota bacterium]
PSRLDAVSQKMLAKNPDERQQSMGEVVADLEACIRPPGPEPPTPPPVQRRATESSSSTDSALKAFLKTMSRVGTAARQAAPSADEETLTYHAESETAMPVGRPTAPSARRKKTARWAIIGGIAGLLVILALGIALLGLTPISEKGGQVRFSSEPDAAEPHDEPTKSEPVPLFQSHLILRWPEADRADAKLSIDDLTYDLSGPWVQSTSNEIKIAVRPGPHKIWIARRGFEPIEDRFQAIAGEDYAIRPEWRTVPGLVERVEPEPAAPQPSDIAESPQPSEPQPEPMEPETPPLDPEAQKRLEAEKRYAEAMKPVDDLIAAWDFSEASAALSKLQFEEQDLAARLAAMRESVAHLVDLKARIISKINDADPPLKKSDLKIRGVGGDIQKADDSGITAKLPREKTESLPWPDVGPQAIEKLIELVSTPDNADDRLAAGVLALASQDPTSAENHFERASSLGAEIGPHLAPLAAMAFSQATDLSDAKKFSDAVTAIEDIEKTYAEIPWFKANKKAFAAALAKAKAGLYEQEAEQLYVEAAKFFGKEQFFDLRPIVQRLKTEYPDSAAATDDGRAPSFARMEEATFKLGEFITVRLDSKGDFSTIQQAIDAVHEPNSLIEIQDNGPYDEAPIIRYEIPGVTIRGKQGCYPIVTCRRETQVLLQVFGSRTTLERLVLVHVAPKREAVGVRVRTAACKLSSTLICMVNRDAHSLVIGGDSEMENCLVLGKPNLHSGKHVLRNCIFVRGGTFSSRSDMRFCTILGGVGTYSTASGVFLDSIVDEIIWDAGAGRHHIENCNLFGGARPEGSRNCISSNPQFRDPANLDYRLLPTSPCIGKASDGGDIGCRYTPEMIELCEKALELRAKGIIKF